MCSPELVKIRMQLPENRGLYSSSIQVCYTSLGLIPFMRRDRPQVRLFGMRVLRHSSLASGVHCSGTPAGMVICALVASNHTHSGTYFGSIFAIKSTIYSTTKEESKFLNFAAGTNISPLFAMPSPIEGFTLTQSEWDTSSSGSRTVQVPLPAPSGVVSTLLSMLSRLECRIHQL